MVSSYKRQARCLKEKIEILNHIDQGDKLMDITKSTGLKQSTLSTWKKNATSIQKLADSGIVLKRKRG